MLLPSVLSTTAGGAAWSGLPADGIETGAGTESNPYQIKTAEELAFMASKVNEGDTSYASAYYRLTTDIVLNESLEDTPNEWTAIGNDDMTPFTGKFDGDGHTISGIVINSTSDYQGLFGISTGTIMNVGVINSSISGGYSVGGVCGSNYGTIENCYSTGAVSGSSGVGGVCGDNYGTITDCYSTGAVSAAGDKVGGFCGYNDDTIKNCYNTGTVSGSSEVGGVCGYNNGGTITNCYNTGAVSGTGGYVGGVCGVKDNGTIEYCYNTGTVNGTDYVGGVCGQNLGGGTITNCYSIGTVSAARDYVGGVCGWNTGAIENCYYDADFYTGNAIGDDQGSAYNVTDKTTADLCGNLLELDFNPTVWIEGSYLIDGKKATATLPQLNVFESTGAPTTTLSLYNFGTEDDPDWDTYTEISSAEELQNINNNRSGNYVLTTDITLTAPAEDGSNWTPIGRGAGFTGKFDGNGHTISGIVIKSTDDYQGLFGYSSGTIMNVGVIDSSISGGYIVGGVCGKNKGTITSCYNTGTISYLGGGSDSESSFGGVCGENQGTIENCYNTGAVIGSNVEGSHRIGGVCGYNNSGTIKNCYSTGEVGGTGNVGGVCGWNYYGTITNCYSTGTVSRLASCLFSYFGGVCGENYGTITNCYYDTDFYTGNAIGDDQGTAYNVIGKTTAALCGLTLPTGFDSAVWTAGSAGSVTVTEGNYGKKTYTSPSLKGVGSAYAFEVDVYNFGTNGSDDWKPYTEISTAEELQNINNNLSGNYVLTTDITLTAPAEDESNWTAIGNGINHFTGKFSGDGHTISGIVINKSDENYQGLFGYSEGTIMNVGVIDSSISGGEYVGGVCGYNTGTIKNCYSTGAVSGNGNVGGVFGYNYGGTIENCYNTGTVTGSGDYVGGVCGQSQIGTIENCYSTGAVSGTRDYVGGVCGRNNGSTIKNCYSTGTDSGSWYVGGVCGDNTGIIENCYSIGAVSASSGCVGGVCGRNYSTITNCYYDTDFYTGNAIGDDQGTADNVTGISTAELCGTLSDLGFYNDVWTDGSYSADGKKATATLPQLKVFEDTSAPTTTLSLYNFGTDEAFDWKPYTEISTAEELKALSNDSTKWSGNYVLTANITLTAPTEDGSNWTAIGTSSTPFTGKFSGDGHTISGIVINKSDKDYQGLFGYSTGTIMNIGVIDSSISGGNSVGGVCGWNEDVGTITNCYSTGAVSAAGECVGGVCGINNGGTIENCYSTGAVSGTGEVGGVCGQNGGTIENCYSTGTVSGSNNVGGVCGVNVYGTIKNCYSTGTVSGNDNVGGVCGDNTGTITNCYYDTDFYTGNAIGDSSGSETNATGISTAALCALFGDSVVWTAGSYSADGKKATATLPQLKVFENTSAPTTTLSLYNFGTDEAFDWKPYTEISTAEALQNINNNLSGNYVLTADITLTAPAEDGSNWTAIGTSSTKFTGKFSGDGHTISGIVINKSGENYQGLFGWSKGTIMNVGVIDSSISGGNSVGGVCGWNEDAGTITNCYSTGAVSAAGNYVGGVCGQNYGTIENCYSTGAVSGSYPVGGVCGWNVQGTIKNCYSTGAVSGTSEVGGVCGMNVGTIEYCYSTGAVSGSSNVGGVCGWNSYGTITNCYYDTDFYTGNAIGDNQGTADNATGKTTAALCGSTLPTGFDSAVWTAGSAGDVTEIDGNYGKKTYTSPSLNGVGSAASYEEKLYNFGTAESPDWRIYTAITTAKQLQDINKNLSGNYVLMNDIDVSVLTADETGTNWTPIGNATDMFTGKFSGDGHTVSGIKIDSDADYQGLFGCSSGTIMNVGVINSSIETSGNYVGGVCGSNNGTVKDCYNNSTVSGGNDVGGVCGVVQCGTITNCYNTGSVSGTSSCIGGVCGANHDGGKITNCYNTGEVSGTDNVGGVCGYNHYAAMDNCYSTGTVSGTDNVGGVCGGCLWYNIKNCYNAGTVSGTGDVGGVCGYRSENGTIANCYYLEGTASKSVGNASDSDDAKRISAKELCNSTLPTFLSEDNWTAGSFNATTGDCKLPQLKVFENVSAQTLDLYNFGTAESPDWRIYTEITTAKQLQDINKNLSGNYILMNDIDVSVLTADENGTNWTPIGNATDMFTGIFEGNGHTVSGIVINSTSDYQGLFGYSTGTIMNVGVIDSKITGGSYVGGICGENCGTITNCYNTGAVSGTDKVGGVCGRNNAYCEITNCYSAGTVSGTQYVGGVCGYNDQGVFDNCYYNKDSYTGEGLGYYYNALPKDVLGMTTKQFASGEVAYLLNGDQSAMIWKQNIGEDKSPAFVGGTVYRNESYSGCIHQPGTMSYVYNNSDNDPIYAGYYKETVVDPTYTEKGYTLYECTVCGDSYKDNYTDRLILTAVKNLAVVEKTELTVTLGWEKNASADGYIIETANASTWERIITLKNNSTNTYTITGLNQSTSYRFRVTPYVMSGSSVLRGNAAVITAKTATTALTGLVATTATNGTAIRLTWEKNSTAAGYIIDKLVDGNWVSVKTLTSNSSVSYTVSGLDSSTAYRFRVTPYTMLNETVIKGAGISVTGKTAPTALTGLAATAATNGTAIRLTWDKNSTAAGYIIDKLVDGNWVSVKTLTSNSYVSYTVSGLDSSKAYRFRVTPYTTFNGDIIKSAGVSVTGKTAPAAISGLKIGNATANYITLSWDKNTTASGYIVEKLVGSTWESVVTVKSSSATRYTVTGLNASTSYRFRVTPFTTFGDGTIRGTGASVTGKTLKA